jgi:hypothetical protein
MKKTKARPSLQSFEKSCPFAVHGMNFYETTNPSPSDGEGSREKQAFSTDAMLGLG